MKISIVGAGPAGLYFAILMKKVDPGHEIDVFERNAPDATFGWGVVFSEETLGALRDADYESYIAITDTFAQWDAIDIHYRDRLIRSRGHSFSAISRKALLRLLQERCAELGVRLRFGVEIESLDGFADSDLIVGADGVNSLVRRLYADQLDARLRVYPSKFAWFGTDLVFDSFTFAFKATEFGLLQAHAYPFDASTSTFIVECNDDVWERAGLDELDEQASMAFCEDLFSAQLQGHRLLSNRSLWTSFVQISGDAWHDGNVVLLGDAAHTAHFTIGSGTKLAMEDSLALANSFVRHDRIEPALVEYELERQPVVERFQDAAHESAKYFENVKHYAGFEPVQFAFNLLTRSGRISYANMTLRDPRFTSTLDTWFAGSADDDDLSLPHRIAPPPMFAPLHLGDATLRNRVALAPSVESPSADGSPSEDHEESFERAAASGAGLLLTDSIAVSDEGRITAECLTLASDEQAAGWERVVRRVHSRPGALVCAQLSHAGRRGATQSRRRGVDLPLRRGGWKLLAASALPYAPGGATPRAMDRDDMDRVQEQFAAAACRAGDAGFDALELNFAHGYLLASFLSPLSNRRDDEYGGDFGNRLAYPLEVLEAVRAAWPAGRPLVARVSATDWAARGAGVEDGICVAQALVGGGCDAIHVVAGQTVAEARPQYRRSFLVALADRIRSQTGVTTLVGGYITTVDEINTTIGAGRADLCLLEARALARVDTVRTPAPAKVRVGVAA